MKKELAKIFQKFFSDDLKKYFITEIKTPDQISEILDEKQIIEKEKITEENINTILSEESMRLFLNKFGKIHEFVYTQDKQWN